MGRKPDPVIASHFIRGEKSGQNTNRYSQTCSHCNTVFPTGRQEALRAHLGRCPDMTPAERSEAISQMYQYPFQASQPDSNNNNNDSQQQEPFPVNVMGTTFDEFTGLNVLAGAAQNLDANNLMIDPSLAEQSTEADIPVIADTMSSYESSDVNHYPTTTADTSWTFPSLSAFQGTINAFNQANITVPEYLAFGSAPASVPPWTFTTVTAGPSSFVSHPNPNPSALSPLTTSNTTGFVHESGRASVPPERDSQSTKSRKVKEPYSESKKEQVSNMRKIGACIRCSRLRKNCDPTRPCSQCTKTKTAKTWVGPCTSLNKGQEFSFWYDAPLEQIRDRILEAYLADGKFESCDGHVEVAFFGHDGPKLLLDVVRCNVGSTNTNDSVVNGPMTEAPLVCYVIDESNDPSQRLVDHAHGNQNRILDAISMPAVDAIARVAAKLSSSPDGSKQTSSYGSAMSGDSNLIRIFEIWLVGTLLTTQTFNPSIRMIDDIGDDVDSPTVNLSLTIIRSQLDAALDSIILDSRRDNVLHKLDANILSQTYKHTFNLVIGIFLLLNTIENYCTFIERHPHNHDHVFQDLDITEMAHQAETLADKYTYCVQNIKMLPKLVTSPDHGCLLGIESSVESSSSSSGASDRANFDMQRAWIAESFFDERELEECFIGGDGGWTGRLWSRIILAMRST